MSPSDRAWCYYRNLVHTVYREIRHAGSPKDPEAKLRVDDSEFAASMGLIKSWRPSLKSTRIYEKIENKTTTAAVLKPYEEVTRLRLEDLAALFGRPGWSSMYGGERWREIVMAAIELGEALDAANGERAEALCDKVRSLEHNSGRLVPRRKGDHNKEKWPALCDPYEA